IAQRTASSRRRAPRGVRREQAGDQPPPPDPPRERPGRRTARRRRRSRPLVRAAHGAARGSVGLARRGQPRVAVAARGIQGVRGRRFSMSAATEAAVSGAEVVVAVDPARAFEAFTAEIDNWWKKDSPFWM